jgi:hypothetical protein
MGVAPGGGSRAASAAIRRARTPATSDLKELVAGTTLFIPGARAAALVRSRRRPLPRRATAKSIRPRIETSLRGKLQLTGPQRA